MGMIQEFKDFAVKGNAMDMAVGIIIGAAFGKIVSSLVNDVIMPPIGLISGGVDFSEKFIALDGVDYATLEAAQEAAAPTLKYGAFLQHTLDFLIVAFAVFMLVKGINSLKKKEEEKPAAPKGPTEVELLAEIRDELKKATP